MLVAVEWPVYPHLKCTMRVSAPALNLVLSILRRAWSQDECCASVSFRIFRSLAEIRRRTPCAIPVASFHLRRRPCGLLRVCRSENL